jgi:two-component system OmpR family response regulator
MATVLVVDDEAHVRELLGHAIGRQGHEVLEADSSESALAVMEKTPADVVFTDIQMPGHDGRWLTIELRKRYPLTAVVLATSVKDLEVSITLRFGVVSYLVKPFNLGSVAAALNMALEWHREAATRGPQKVEEAQLEKWIDSLEIL